MACNFTEKKSLARVLSCEFCEIFKNTFFFRKPLMAVLDITGIRKPEFSKKPACNFVKKRLWYRCFPMSSSKFLRTPIFIEHLLWLLFYFPNNVSATSLNSYFCHDKLIKPFIKNLSSPFSYITESYDDYYYGDNRRHCTKNEVFH